jgi:CDP-glucose 4,6-dehydratase
MENSFSEKFKNKSVLITRYTGFKESWLTAWHVKLGANVFGIALNSPAYLSHFVAAKYSTEIKGLRIDVRNGQEVDNVIVNVNPNFVFHIAVQSLVRKTLNEIKFDWNLNK